MHLFREVRHGDGRHAAEREPFERAQYQQLMPLRRDGYAHGEKRRQRQRKRHQPVPAPALGNKARDKYRKRKRGCRHRQRQTALRRTHTERV
jgi:hypothetical protein